MIIPYQELLGNYNHRKALIKRSKDYTIPRTVRGTTTCRCSFSAAADYTIPRTVRELHLLYHTKNCWGTTKSHAQRMRVAIIPYQELLGNYNSCARERNRGHYTIPRTVRELQPATRYFVGVHIIPYQELLGNYNSKRSRFTVAAFIPYQELFRAVRFSDFLHG